MNHLRTWLLLGLCLLGSCTEERISGNSVETESDITARILPVDSILPPWNRPIDSLTVAVLRFDSTNFDFKHTQPDGSDLRIVRKDSTPVPFSVVVWDKVAKKGRLHLRLDSQSLRRRVDLVMKWGGVPRTQIGDPKTTWEGIPATQALYLNSVLVDDFERATDSNMLPSSSSWIRTPGDSTVKVLAFDRVAAGLGRSGNALHTSFETPGTQTYLVVQTRLTSVPRGARSLRSLDSIEFWARGKARVMVAFDNNNASPSYKAWKGIDLDSTKWVRVRLRPKDLDTANGIGGNKGWEAVRDSVTHITFIAGRGSEMWLDNIRLYGVDVDDIR